MSKTNLNEKLGNGIKAFEWSSASI